MAMAWSSFRTRQGEITKESAEVWISALTADRFLVPDAETLVKAIQNDDLDLEMATTDEEKHALQVAKTSKTWRTLRIAGKTKLTLFDKVDDGKNLEALFQTNGAEHGLKSEDMPDTDGGGGESLGPVSADKTGNDGSMEVRTDQVVSHAAVAEAS
jgi:THO complex subunit 1